MRVDIDGVVIDTEGLILASSNLAASIEQLAQAIQQLAANNAALSAEEKEILLSAVKSVDRRTTESGASQGGFGAG
jgi:ABC-type amino acid transport system permease subunit